MKRLFTLQKVFSFLIISLAFTQVTHAQGNLKFYETKYIVLSGTANGQNVPQLVVSQNLTVATGHVLKVENIMGINTANNSVYSMSLAIDDIVYVSAGSSTVNTVFPVWLPAGTYSLKLNCNPSSTSTISIKAALSAIDFQIVP